MSLALLGLGTAVPATRYTQEEIVEVAAALAGPHARRTALEGLYRKTGIKHRHSVHGHDFYEAAVADRDLAPPGDVGTCGPDTAQRMATYEAEALPLALDAAERALAESRLPASALTHLVTVSCTGFAAPGVDIGLIKRLRLSPRIERTHVGFMGCHGALNGLRVANAIAAAHPAARVLLCATELCSIHLYYPWNPERLVGNALFADGAAALVGGTPIGGEWRCAASGSCLFPDSEDAMQWSIGNHGFEMVLSPRVPNLIAAHLRPWLDEWLQGQRLTVGDVASWAIHPGGPRVVAAIEEILGLNPEQTWASREVLTEFGNMSSPTVLFILDRLRRARAPRPCVALGFGPGLVAEAALFR